ncbi:hypothetical protein K0M31_003473 [Melipona bicolor]|uniref:Uncharacterized protein n=1 Tax=Melipona bicolor TaxID=60889 RepID=A0AA40FZK6_9HYME|nr:hypothetical protein K0M31_003473 [Melipona bicolor]
MNPLSLLPPPPPPPSNFFSDLPSLPPSSPRHGTNTPAAGVPAASDERVYVSACSLLLEPASSAARR